MLAIKPSTISAAAVADLQTPILHVAPLQNAHTRPRVSYPRCTAPAAAPGPHDRGPRVGRSYFRSPTQPADGTPSAATDARIEADIYLSSTQTSLTRYIQYPLTSELTLHWERLFSNTRLSLDHCAIKPRLVTLFIKFQLISRLNLTAFLNAYACGVRATLAHTRC